MALKLRGDYSPSGHVLLSHSRRPTRVGLDSSAAIQRPIRFVGSSAGGQHVVTYDVGSGTFSSIGATGSGLGVSLSSLVTDIYCVYGRCRFLDE